ncbi:GDSL esterase/lipase At5g03810 [Selaginella moellendorffii]|uniref:GDSL esterase/lipase At5g03810 n=1 Tax=Selaginella moellendorffii TaxID=88036 RepID=UPI000D1C42D7|nr:GDSL esterase/lipase At5g03810 [Selaginella moellendorffii]|eukprot:XP_024528860.1 GDSL esterase/lipase At5g03810 [Selaginella moellendorffii]
MANNRFAGRAIDRPRERAMLALLLFFLSLDLSLGQYDHANAYGVPAILIFGDSTVDAGNNNVFSTIMHSNHAPYGRDFGFPTGRFSNGLLAPDIVAQKLNLPFPLAFTSPNATGDNLIFGANFASAASGLVDSTASLFNVASSTQQLKWFASYRQQLERIAGPDRAQSILSRALYVISSGSNDYIYYRLNTRLSSQYNNEQFRELLIKQTSQFIQELYNVGGRRFAVVSVPPLGCLPSEITTAGKRDRSCVEDLNSKAVAHNVALQQLLTRTKASLPGTKVAYLDCYSVLFDAIHNPAKYGFSETNRGCCGSGLIEVGDLCNGLSMGTCSDSSKFVFWDSFHPTQAMYGIIAEVFYNQAAAVL